VIASRPARSPTTSCRGRNTLIRTGATRLPGHAQHSHRGAIYRSRTMFRMTATIPVRSFRSDAKEPRLGVACGRRSSRATCSSPLTDEL